MVLLWFSYGFPMVLAGWQVPQDDPEEGPGTLWQQVTGAQRV